jgi:hypothetical protein
MEIALVLVMDQRPYPPPVDRVNGCQPLLVPKVRRVGIVTGPQHRSAVDPKPVERGPDHAEVVEMREQELDATAIIAKRPCRQICGLSGLTCLLAPIKDDPPGPRLLNLSAPGRWRDAVCHNRERNIEGG